MSTLEIILGIAGVAIILIVFLIIMFIGIAYMTSWLEKGISPNNTFPRNPKGNNLSQKEQRALNVGAILSANNRDFCDSLQTSKPMAKKNIQEMMKRDWDICSTEQAMEQLESLKANGHRQINNAIVKNASKLFVSEELQDLTVNKIYEQMGFSLIDKRVLEEFKDEVALAEKNIDLLDTILNANSFEDIKEYQNRFGDEKTFSCCIQIFYQLYESCLTYIRRAANLKETLCDLMEKGYLGTDISEIENIDVSAWDLGRIVNVARYSYDLGYITENVAWEYIYFAENESALIYSDWEDFARAYIVGRAIWGGKNINLYNNMDMVKKLKEDKKSPWKIVSLH